MPDAIDTPRPNCKYLAHLQRYALAYITAVAVIARLALVVVYQPKLWDTSSDAYAFAGVADYLVDGKGFRDWTGDRASRFPVLPVFMACILAVGGHSRLVVMVVFALLGGLTTPLMHWTGMKLTKRRSVALLASAGWALYPMFVFLSVMPLTENLSLPITVWLIGALVLVYERPDRWWPAALAGVALGLELLNRSTIALFAPCIGLWLWMSWGWKGTGRAISRTAVIAVVSLAVLAPWWIRNYRLLGEFVPFTTQGGYALYGDNNEKILAVLDGDTDLLFKDVGIPGLERPGGEALAVGRSSYSGFHNWAIWDRMKSGKYSEVERDRQFYAEAVAFMREHPAAVARYSIVKFRVFWMPYNNPINQWTYWAVCLLALPAIFIGRLRHRVWLIVWFLIGTRVLAAMIYSAVPRYKDPIMPFIIILAAVTVVSVAELIFGVAPAADVKNPEARIRNSA
jgi:4-amino-4-deoxy-L-arabinose transferase-like glycosyltransferase